MKTRLIRSAAVVAIIAVFAGPGGFGAGAQVAPAGGTAAAVATPHTAEGHPDLSGMWSATAASRGAPDEQGNVVFKYQARPCSPGQVDCAPGVNLERDSTFTGRSNPNRPLYKPEFWDKVQALDLNTNKEDPLFQCQPLGVPRMGPPTKIVQLPKELIFLYAQGGAGSATQDFRIIPVDGRPHDPLRSKDLTFYGDAIGRWQGDSLIVDSLGFNDLTWIGRGGYFHTIDMHVIEKFTRGGNTLTWQATVEDPAVLIKPWTMDAVTMNLNLDPKATIVEGLPCDERDQEHMVTQERH